MSDKRQELVNTAVELFSAHGFHATGIDRIAEVAKVSKKTMYHHFRSKEELILAALREHDGRFRNDFMRAVRKSGDTPEQRLLGVFDVAHAWFSDNKFYGCMFINAIGEYSEPNTAIRKVCKEFKRLMLSYMEELAEAAGIPNPKEVAATLALLLEGSIVTAQVSQAPDAAKTAKTAAGVIIQSALSK
ncbi:MAG: TetR/AcrR family transcriptional regulator [Pseudomonadota bacterium]